MSVHRMDDYRKKNKGKIKQQKNKEDIVVESCDPQRQKEIEQMKKRGVITIVSVGVVCFIAGVLFGSSK